MTLPLPVLVFYCADALLTRAFYENLGLTFMPDQHPGGPVHYVFSEQGFVLELYPLGKRRPERPDAPEPRQSLIFEVDRFDDVIYALRAMEAEIIKITNRENLRHASALDPDRRMVLLIERDPDAIPPTLH